MSVWFNGKVKVVLQQFTVITASSLNIKSHVRLLNRSTFAASPWWACRTISASLQVPTCNYLHLFFLFMFSTSSGVTQQTHTTPAGTCVPLASHWKKHWLLKAKLSFLWRWRPYVESRPPPPPTTCSQLIDDGDCNSLNPASRMAVTEHFALSLRALFIHFLLGRR